MHVEGGMFSRDGRTRTFDADAVLLSDGVAMVLLMRLADAEREGRRILGAIHGVADERWQARARLKKLNCLIQ